MRKIQQRHGNFVQNRDFKCYIYMFYVPGANKKNKNNVLAQFPILNQVKNQNNDFFGPIFTDLLLIVKYIVFKILKSFWVNGNLYQLKDPFNIYLYKMCLFFKQNHDFKCYKYFFCASGATKEIIRLYQFIFHHKSGKNQHFLVNLQRFDINV